MDTVSTGAAFTFTSMPPEFLSSHGALACAMHHWGDGQLRGSRGAFEGGVWTLKSVQFGIAKPLLLYHQQIHIYGSVAASLLIALPPVLSSMITC